MGVAPDLPPPLISKQCFTRPTSSSKSTNYKLPSSVIQSRYLPPESWIYSLILASTMDYLHAPSLTKTGPPPCPLRFGLLLPLSSSLLWEMTRFHFTPPHTRKHKAPQCSTPLSCRVCMVIGWTAGPVDPTQTAVYLWWPHRLSAVRRPMSSDNINVYFSCLLWTSTISLICIWVQTKSHKT